MCNRKLLKIYIFGFHFRTDGKLFNLTRLKAHTKVSYDFITEVMYVDDLCFVAESPEDLQQLMEKLTKSCRVFGLKINIIKTEIMASDTVNHGLLNIPLDGAVLKQVDKFKYLGSTH